MTEQQIQTRKIKEPEALKRMKGYDKAIEQLKADADKEKEKAKNEEPKN
jgi:hypothetical protein